MPRMTPRRPATAVRFGDDVLDRIDAVALRENLLKTDGDPNRSEFIRLAVEYAFENMPVGWRPKDPDSMAIGALRGVLPPPVAEPQNGEQLAETMFLAPSAQ